MPFCLLALLIPTESFFIRQIDIDSKRVEGGSGEMIEICGTSRESEEEREEERENGNEVRATVRERKSERERCDWQ